MQFFDYACDEAGPVRGRPHKERNMMRHRPLAGPLAALLLAAITMLPAAQALAQTSTQNFPARPLRLLAGQPPGGATDMVARIISQKLGESMGQPVVVENRVGGGGITAMETVVKSAPDGHTLMIVGTSFLVLTALYPELTFDPMKDMAPVARAANAPSMLVVYPGLPAKTVADLVELAKAKPGELNFGSSAYGSAGHMGGEMFQKMTGTRMTHVPYKGGASALPDLMAGQLQVLFNPPITAIPMVKAGKLRALAVTSARRLTAMPDVPTVAELGFPGYDAATWFSLLARSGAPAAVVDRLARDLQRVVETAGLREQFAAQAIEFQWGNAADVSALVRKDLARWGEVIRRGGIRVEPL
jgi:tripartite-type tricarboxylate transporter receptor subunit TctC